MKIGDMVHYVDEYIEKDGVSMQQAGVHNFAFITLIHNENTVNLEVHRPFEIVYKDIVKHGDVADTWHEIE